jgi:tetratricopeptide (TPR) repeat protein
MELFLESLFAQTQYPDFRVWLLPRETVEIHPALRTRDNIDVVTYPSSAGRWQAVLDLVRGSDTEYLMLMIPGAIAIQSNWLERLVAHFQKADVAVVAPRLVSSDKAVVGGGIITDSGSYSVGMEVFGGLALGDMDGALKWFAEAVRCDDSYAEAFYNLGTAHWQRGEHTECLKRLAQALQRNQRSQSIVTNTASVLVELGKTEDARTLCDVFLQHDPFAAQVRSLLDGFNRSVNM